MTSLPRRSLRLPLNLFRPAPQPLRLALPLAGGFVRAGFPSPADDYDAGTLDLNEHLIAHKEATFYHRYALVKCQRKSRMQH